MAYDLSLQQGTNGLPVVLLQFFLLGGGYNVDELIPDGDYGEKTAMAVRYLQAELGVTKDGNFGPQTRAALKSRKDVDFDLLLQAALTHEEIVDSL